MATGKISKSKPIIGYFRTPTLAAGVTTEITSNNILEGSLPVNIAWTLLKVSNASNNSQFTVNLYTEGSKIYINSNVAQNYIIRWFDFA